MVDINLKALREQLESLGEPSSICKRFEHSSLIADKELHKSLNPAHAALPLKIRLTNSKLKEADEIKEKLEILCYHLSLLRNTALTKDYKTARKAIHKLFKDELTSMGTVISDVENFKRHIEEMDSDIKKLLSANLPLDYKLSLEKEHKRHISRLIDIHAQHTSALKNIGTLFLGLTKYMLNDNEFKSFLSQQALPEFAIVNA